MKMKFFFLLLIISLYGILYVATDKFPQCNGDCEKFEKLENYFLKDSNYIYSLRGCGRAMQFDSICIPIKDTIASINWNVFADSVCAIATQFGLPKRHIFIINNFSNPTDTSVQRSCQ